jgi:hypothetical protein
MPFIDMLEQPGQAVAGDERGSVRAIILRAGFLWS